MTTPADDRRPGRPGVCAYARFDEGKVVASGRGAAWLAAKTQWFHAAGMLTTVGDCIVGGTVYLHAHSLKRAQELVGEAIRNGVPANCAAVAAQVDKPKRGARAVNAATHTP
jgi:hypothetical protein